MLGRDTNRPKEKHCGFIRTKTGELFYTQCLGYLKYKDKLREARLTLSDFSSSVPFAVSTLEFMPQNADIVVDGPFAEPDEYFLARQRAAYGDDTLVDSLS